MSFNKFIIIQHLGAKAPVFVPFWKLKFWAEARNKTGSLPGAKAPGYSAI
ncbi:hypothetical protein [Daejeonella sp.]|nr:hypothetical protein [Daejeonella sp.]